MDNTSSRVLDVTSGVPQRSLLGPIRFCIFIKNLPYVLKFSELFIFSDDLKISAVRKNFWQVQDDLNQLEICVKKNKMELAVDKCAKVTFRGQDRSYKLMDAKRDESKTVKDLGNHCCNRSNMESAH